MSFAFETLRLRVREYTPADAEFVLDMYSRWNVMQFLGSGDIQSLADLGNSYAAVREMRPVPFDLQDIARLAAATAVPLLPLGLMVFSLEELVTRIVKILF